MTPPGPAGDWGALGYRAVQVVCDATTVSSVRRPFSG